MTLAARPAIVIPTAVTAWKAIVERHPLIMTTAELRCLRERLGLTPAALAAAIGRSERNVRRWENGEQRISRETADAMIALASYTDAAVDALVEAAPSTITVYRDDEAFRAHEDTGSRVLSAAWHRMVAARTAERIPGSVIAYRGE
jgi:DNA-binding transcriptional regulator YiaG